MESINFEDCIVVTCPEKDDSTSINLECIISYYTYHCCIIPNCLVRFRRVWDVFDVAPIYHIKGFQVVTEIDLSTSIEYLCRIHVMGHHPNVSLETGLYCLPNNEKIKYNELYFYTDLMSKLHTWYLDDCYYRPKSYLYKSKEVPTMSFSNFNTT